MKTIIAQYLEIAPTIAALEVEEMVSTFGIDELVDWATDELIYANQEVDVATLGDTCFIPFGPNFKAGNSYDMFNEFLEDVQGDCDLFSIQLTLASVGLQQIATVSSLHVEDVKTLSKAIKTITANMVLVEALKQGVECNK